MEETAMMPSKTSRHLRASILLAMFGAALFIGCSTLREESVASGKRRAIPETAPTESVVAIYSRPTNSHSNNGFESERLWGPYND
jgi:hypothetical protein